MSPPRRAAGNPSRRPAPATSLCLAAARVGRWEARAACDDGSGGDLSPFLRIRAGAAVPSPTEMATGGGAGPRQLGPAAADPA